ncbi:MAG: molybdopterin dinucleotide binding domain-containing protein, partial [Dehalococcoidia bacterium]|nr:molybdopterin dinucleotide binding domain-containing protein [Dehalococcoidia bacterium]
IDADLTGTARIHDSTLVLEPPQGAGVHEKWLTNFKSHSGKAVLNKAPWELFSDFYERITPKGDELWVTSGRYGEVWQSAYDDLRKPYLTNRTPEHFVEIHPDDAVERGIESGDWIEIVNDDVLIQTGGFTFVEGEAYTFTRLVEEGLIKIGSGRMTAIAVVTDVVRQGVMFTNFMWPRWPGSAANSLVHRVPDPIANRYRFKLGKGRVRKTGESEFKRSFDVTTFKSRAIG